MLKKSAASFSDIVAHLKQVKSKLNGVPLRVTELLIVPVAGHHIFGVVTSYLEDITVILSLNLPCKV